MINNYLEFLLIWGMFSMGVLFAFGCGYLAGKIIMQDKLIKKYKLRNAEKELRKTIDERWGPELK